MPYLSVLLLVKYKQKYKQVLQIKHDQHQHNITGNMT